VAEIAARFRNREIMLECLENLFSVHRVLVLRSSDLLVSTLTPARQRPSGIVWGQ